LELNARGDNMQPTTIEDFLTSIDTLVQRIASTAKSVNPDCANNPALNIINSKQGAKTAALYMDYARTTLKQSGKNNSEIYALTIIDPYIAGALGDLIEFVFGHREKAEFLTRIAEKYPKTNEMMQTGMINLYYQLADSKLKSEGWPLDLVISDIDFARQGADYMISLSRSRAQQQPADQVAADQIFDLYCRNLLLFLTTTLEIYNQRGLAGEDIKEFHRQNWTQAFSRLIRILNVRSAAPFATFDDLPTSTIDDKDRNRWPSIFVEERAMFNANLTAALSAVLRGSNGSRSSSAACAAARYYLSIAQSIVPSFVHEVELGTANRARLDQYILSVSEHVHGSCA
jgi:hypothetical protein